MTCECLGARITVFESHSLIICTGDLMKVEIWAWYVAFDDFPADSVLRPRLTALSLEQNLGIMIASLPACRRFLVGDWNKSRLRSYLNRLGLSIKQTSLASSRHNAPSRQDNRADKLVPLKDIQVKDSLESQFAGRTSSEGELGIGYNVPDEWKSVDTVGQTAVETVRVVRVMYFIEAGGAFRMFLSMPNPQRRLVAW